MHILPREGHLTPREPYGSRTFKRRTKRRPDPAFHRLPRERNDERPKGRPHKGVVRRRVRASTRPVSILVAIVSPRPPSGVTPAPSRYPRFPEVFRYGSPARQRQGLPCGRDTVARVADGIGPSGAAPRVPGKPVTCGRIHARLAAGRVGTGDPWGGHGLRRNTGARALSLTLRPAAIDPCGSTTSPVLSFEGHVAPLTGGEPSCEGSGTAGARSDRDRPAEANLPTDPRTQSCISSPRKRVHLAVGVARRRRRGNGYRIRYFHVRLNDSLRGGVAQVKKQVIEKFLVHKTSGSTQ